MKKAITRLRGCVACSKCLVLPITSGRHADQHLILTRNAVQPWGKRVAQIFRAHHGFAGARKIHGVLALTGWSCSVKLVARIMREQGLAARYRKAWRATTIGGHRAGVTDLVKQEFHPDAYQPGKALVGDITYIRARQGWLYLATVIDLATRKILGYLTPREAFQRLLVASTT